MEELLRTNDPVLQSFVSSLLDGAGIAYTVFDTNMSVMEGSIGVLPRRILVEGDCLAQARRVLIEAGIGDDLPGAENS